MHTSSSHGATHAEVHLSDAPVKSGRCVIDREVWGIRWGRSLERLGVAGETSGEDFSALCGGNHLRTGTRLTPRVKARTWGPHIDVRCPTPVSIPHASRRYGSIDGKRRRRASACAPVVMM